MTSNCLFTRNEKCRKKGTLVSPTFWHNENISANVINTPVKVLWSDLCLILTTNSNTEILIANRSVAIVGPLFCASCYRNGSVQITGERHLIGFCWTCKPQNRFADHRFNAVCILDTSYSFFLLLWEQHLKIQGLWGFSSGLFYL